MSSPPFLPQANWGQVRPQVLDIGNPLAGLERGVDSMIESNKFKQKMALQKQSEARMQAAAARDAQLHPYRIQELEYAAKAKKADWEAYEAAKAAADQLSAGGQSPTHTPQSGMAYGVDPGRAAANNPGVVQPGMTPADMNAQQQQQQAVQQQAAAGQGPPPVVGGAGATPPAGAPQGAVQGVQGQGGPITATQGQGLAPAPGGRVGFTPEIQAINEKMGRLSREAQIFEKARRPWEAQKRKDEISNLNAQRDMLIKDQLARAQQERKEVDQIEAELRVPGNEVERYKQMSEAKRIQTAKEALPKLQAKVENERQTLRGVMDDVRYAETMIRKYPKLVGGTFSEFASRIPGGDGIRLRKTLERIGGYNALNTMFALKEASPTGATGFGAMNQAELDLIRNSKGILDMNMTAPQLLNTMGSMRKAYKSFDGAMQANFDATVQMARTGKIPDSAYVLKESPVDWSESKVARPKSAASIVLTPTGQGNASAPVTRPEGSAYPTPDGVSP